MTSRKLTSTGRQCDPEPPSTGTTRSGLSAVIRADLRSGVYLLRLVATLPVRPQSCSKSPPQAAAAPPPEAQEHPLPKTCSRFNPNDTSFTPQEQASLDSLPCS